MINSASITAVLWWNLDMVTSDNLDIVVGGVDVISVDTEGLVVGIDYLPLCVGVVGVYGVFDGSLVGLITMTEGFLHS